jgi:UrcA family protein
MTMNTITHTIKLQRMTATVVFGALALSFAAMCPAGDTTGANQSTVKYADLSVSSPSGAAALYARINVAANGVCRTLDGRGLASKTYFNRCVHEAIADAVNKVDQPALYSIYNAKNSTPKPIMVASSQNR